MEGVVLGLALGQGYLAIGGLILIILTIIGSPGDPGDA